MALKKVNWGIIGCGDVTEAKSGPAFNIIEGSELIAVMRRDPVKVADYARRHNVPKYYTDAGKLISDTDINAIYVATPPDTHAYYAIKALEAGKPVYVEKPMARTYAECKAITEASKKHKTPLFVAYYRRSLPGFVKIKKLIDSKEIGNPRTVCIRLFKPATNEEMKGKLSWRVKPEIAGAGHFYDLASHQIDYLEYLFGPVMQVTGLATNLGKFYKAEDTVSASFVFENNVVGTGTWCFVSSEAGTCDRIEIIGDKGRIMFSCFDFTPIIHESGTEKHVYSNTKPEHVQYYLIEQVVNQLLGKGKSPSTGITGAHTNWVMEEIVKQYYQ